MNPRNIDEILMWRNVKIVIFYTINKSPFRLLFTLIFALSVITSQAQFVGTPYIGYISKPVPPSTEGMDFWMAFADNYNTTFYGSGTGVVPYFALNIASQLATTITISITANSHSYTYNLAAGVSRQIRLDSMRNDGSAPSTAIDERLNVYLGSSGAAIFGASSRTLHITSSNPISVYAFNTQQYSTDATVVYPTAAWGTDYYQLAYHPQSTYIGNEIIIANQNGTDIFVNSNSSTPTATLTAGQAYVTNGGYADLTGRHFRSSKPVAYFAGATGMYIPFGTGSGDALDEQMLPTNTWDTAYFVPNVPEFTNPSASNNNRIRIVASQNGTVVKYTGASLPASLSLGPNFTGNNQIASGQTLDSGKWVELAISGNTNTGGAYITASKPIGVAGYLLGNNSGNGIGSSSNGDPDNAMMPGLRQMIQQTTFSPFIFPSSPALGYTNFYQSTAVHGAVIVTPTSNTGNITMQKGGTGANLLTIGSWVNDTNGSGMSTYRHTFSNTDINSSFTITNNNPTAGNGIIVLCYGIASAESYFYNAGSGAYSLQ